MKLVLLASVAFLAAPAISQTNTADQMVITAPSRPTVVQWTQKIEHQLDRHLAYPQTFRASDVAEGTVAVRFSCGADGKPASIVLFQGSGDRLIDRAAMRAIAHIETLHPMPARLARDSTFQANIIFAADDESLVRQQDVLQRKEAQRVAREGKRGQSVVVLDFSRRAAG